MKRPSPGSASPRRVGWLAGCVAGLAAGFAQGGADLSLTKTADLDKVRVGQELVYTLTATNHGPGDVNVYAVDDQLPAGAVTLLDAESSPECLLDGNTEGLVICTDTALAAAGSREFFLKVRVDAQPVPNRPRNYLSAFDQGMGQGVVYSRSGSSGATDYLSTDALQNPGGIAWDGAGYLLLADRGATEAPDEARDGVVYRIDPQTGVQEVLSAGKLLWDPTDVLEGGDGQIYVSDRSAWLILRIDAETGDQTVIAELDDPGGLLWHENTLYVTSILGASIFRVEPDPAGATELLAIGAPLVQPTAMALYQDSLIIADAMGGLLSMDIATGTVAVVTSDPATMGASDVAIDGDIAFLATGDGTTLVEVDLSTSQVVDVNPIDNAGSLNAVALGQDAEIVLYNSARINAPGNDDPQSGNDKASVKTPFDQNPEPVGLNEIVVVTDTVEVLAIPNNEITETVTVADQVQVVALPMPNAGVAEAVSVTDTWQVMATPEMRFVETVTVTDTVQVSTLAVPTIRFTETIGVTDSVALLPPRQVGMVETVKVSDSVTLKPFDDDDGDGLTDAIDGLFIASRYYDQRFEYSDQFTDRHLGGDTFGALVDRAGLSFELDNHKTNGVEVFVSGEAEAQGVMKACEIPAEILVSNGDRFELRCGSLILRVLTGDVVVRIDQDTRVEVPAGAIVIVELIADGQFSIRNDAGSTAAVTVVDRGVVVDLQPGETMPTSVWESRAIPVAGYLGWVLMGLSLVLVAGFRRFGKGPRI